MKTVEFAKANLNIQISQSMIKNATVGLTYGEEDGAQKHISFGRKLQYIQNTMEQMAESFNKLVCMDSARFMTGYTTTSCFGHVQFHLPTSPMPWGGINEDLRMMVVAKHQKSLMVIWNYETEEIVAVVGYAYSKLAGETKAFEGKDFTEAYTWFCKGLPNKRA